jgi:hypothetical protein
LVKGRPEIAERVSALIAERKIGTMNALATASQAERQEASRTLSDQILHKIKDFFHSVFAHSETAAVH